MSRAGAAQRGNVAGAVSLLRRGADHLATVRPPAPFGIDLAGLLGFAAQLADDLAAGVEIGPQRLQPRLVA